MSFKGSAFQKILTGLIIFNTVWTTDVKAAWKAKLIADKTSE